MPGIVAVIVAVAALGPALAEDLNGRERVVAGVRLLGHDLGGARYEEVASVAEQIYAERAQQPILIRAEGETVSIRPAAAGIGLDVDATSQAIISAAQQDSWIELLGRLAGRTPVREVVPAVLVDEKLVAGALTPLMNKVNRPARDAALAIDGGGVTKRAAESERRLNATLTGRMIADHVRAGDTSDVEAAIDVTPARVGDGDLVDVEQTAQRILAGPITIRYGTQAWPIDTDTLSGLVTVQTASGSAQAASLQWNERRVNALFSNIARAVDVQPEDAIAEWRNGRFVLVGGKDGYRVDVAQSVSTFETVAVGAAREAPLTVTVIHPGASAADWQVALGLANQAAASEIRFTWRDRAFTIGPQDLAGVIRFERDRSSGRYMAIVDSAALNGKVKGLAEQISRPPRDARFKMQDGKMVLLSEGEDGVAMDVASTTAAAARAVFGDQRDVAVVATVARPSAQMADVGQVSFPDLIVEATTSYAGSVPARAHNVELAAERINGTIVPPGAMFSFNQSAGPTTVASGYQVGYGIAIENGEAVTVPAEAGGICQVATTIFHAAFWAGFPIVERQPHLYWISRYGSPPLGMPGLDATVDDPYVDFKFRNSTSSWLMVESASDGANLTFRIRGKKPAWQVRVDQPVITNVVPASSATIRQDDATLARGQELAVEHAENGFSSRIRRVISSAGKVLDTTDILSTYRPSRNVILVGTADARPTPAATPTAVAPNNSVPATPTAVTP